MAAMTTPGTSEVMTIPSDAATLKLGSWLSTHRCTVGERYVASHASRPVVGLVVITGERDDQVAQEVAQGHGQEITREHVRPEEGAGPVEGSRQEP
jgi:hypothetical protein